MSITDGCSFKAGTVTALNPQVGAPNMTSVFIDGAYAFGVLTDLVIRNQLHVGKELDEEDISILLQDEAILRARSIAQGYLAHAPRTAYQVRKRLAGRGFSGHEIDRVIRDLMDLGHIDDRKYAAEYAAARFNHKGYGPERIRHELLADGVPNDDISAAIAANFNPENLAIRGKMMLEKFQSRVHGTLPERKKKLTGYLIRRGYGYNMARDLVQDVLAQDGSGASRR